MRSLNNPYILLLIFGLLMATQLEAQVAQDALIISRNGPTGTARFLGIGGAGVSLGGDVSSAYLNPAGLGFYNRSSVVLTPSFEYVTTDGNFLGNNTEAYNTNFGVANFGIIINNTSDDIVPSDYRGGSFAITFNRTNSYNRDYNFGPAENPFSILDEFALQANGVNADELLANAQDGFFPDYIDAAYENFLINAYPNDRDRYVASIPEGTTAEQLIDIEESGRQSEWNFSYGGNYKDKVYFGLSIGFKTFSYERNNRFQEVPLYTQDYIQDVEEGSPFFPVDEQLSINFVDDVILEETLLLNGGGINANLGVIYRPIDELTLGLSYKTPTFYSITEEYFFDLTSSVSGIQESNDTDPFFVDQTIEGNRNIAEYTLSTPSRISGGVTYFISKYGFLTADVEYVNYANNRFNSPDFPTNDVNDDIDQIMESVFNYRLGAELRYQILRFRLGYAMYADPTQYVGDEINRDRMVLTGGIGVNTPTFFADLALVNTRYGTDFFPYLGAANFPAPLPQSDNNIMNTVLTVGFNF
ncbi:MAG: OmpP1/FadL family transporter [Cyclobacteriaceae bacterium]